MTIKVGINGMGRIGRMVIRAIIESQNKNIKINHINNRSNSEKTCNLIKYDSVHGKFDANLSFDENHLIINNRSNSEATSKLIKYDSIHGKLNANLDFDPDHLIINNNKIIQTTKKNNINTFNILLLLIMYCEYTRVYTTLLLINILQHNIIIITILL